LKRNGCAQSSLKWERIQDMRTIAYIRVSTQEQAREGISLDNQRAKIEAYCQLHDLELVTVIKDGGHSGKDLKRPGMQRLMDLIAGRRVQAVVVYKLDRLSRRVIDTLSIIELMSKHGVALHSLSEKIDTGSAMGKFFLNIMASLAQMERDLISERTKDALQHLVRNGQRAGQIPYGYRLGEDGKTLVPLKSEQKAISRMTQLRNEGLSYGDICRILTAEGFPPAGEKWHAQTVRRALKRAEWADKKQGSREARTARPYSNILENRL
jgi:site-specific DNA recombinase